MTSSLFYVLVNHWCIFKQYSSTMYMYREEKDMNIFADSLDGRER